MTDSDKHTRIIIIGAGISGLSTAHRLWELHQQEKNGHLDIDIIDSRDRIGGVIHTIERDGFLIDTGPDNFVTAKPWALALARRLGLESEIIPTNESHRSAMVVRKGKMLPIPEGFLLMAPTKLLPIITTPLFSLPGKLRMGLEWFLPPKKSEQDESLASFVSRRFGREALDRVVQPLISGIYTAPPERLSLSATMPRFLELEKKYGSVIKGMRAAGKKQKQAGSGARYGMFVTFRNGLQTIVHGLRDRLGDVDFHLGQTVVSVGKNPAQKDPPMWQVRMEDGNILEAQGVVIAGPSGHAAALLKKTDPGLADQLSSVGYASSAVIHLAYRRDQISHPLNSFGCVVPIVERKNIIAASFSSVKYAGRAPDGFVLLRAFMGGAIRPDMIERDDDALVALARQDLDELLGIGGKPLFSVVSRWPDSMAQYEVGHPAKSAAIKARIGLHKGLEICGNGFEGVGVPDCIHAGERAAEALLNDLGLTAGS
jgi:protoporphyrinogen/coproporphyrinogen III oxidase